VIVRVTGYTADRASASDPSHQRSHREVLQMAVRAVRHFIFVALVGLLTAACSGGQAGAGGASQLASSGGGGTAATPAISVGGRAPFRASGALVRVVNLYNGGANGPGPIDVYGDFKATGTPLITVRYGTISNWFDPGILDDQRNATLTFLPAGKTGTDDEVAHKKSDTLKGGERTTIVLAKNQNTNSSGGLIKSDDGLLSETVENGTTYPLPTPPASQSVLIVNNVALQALHKFPGTDQTALFIATGKDCLPTIDSDPLNGSILVDQLGRVSPAPQPISSWGTVSFAMPAGSQSVSFHLVNAYMNCSGKSVFPEIPVQLAVGGQTFLFLYSPDGKVLKNLVVPVGN
jgi:hypothetical protein